MGRASSKTNLAAQVEDYKYGVVDKTWIGGRNLINMLLTNSTNRGAVSIQNSFSQMQPTQPAQKRLMMGMVVDARSDL